MNIEELAEKLRKEDCTTVKYDNTFLAILDFATFENSLSILGYELKWDEIPLEVKKKIADGVRGHFTDLACVIKVCESDTYYIDFDFYLEIEDTRCNYDFIHSTLVKFQDLVHKYMDIYIKEFVQSK